MPKKKHLLTKSAFLNGLICDRLFWIYQNDREQLPAFDENIQAIFDQGHQIGSLAKTLYPDGIEIDWSSGHESGIAQTAAAIKARRPIFEAGFQYGETHARADILNPVGGGSWDLVEVKSSAGVKDEHMSDVAFQKHVYENAGIHINKCFIMHINRSYVRIGDLDLRALLICKDVTGDVKQLKAKISSEIERQLSIMALDKAPEAMVSPNCPTSCLLHDRCWSFLPENHVFSLYRAGQTAFDLMRKSILSIRDIPDDYPLAYKQAIQVACEKSGKPHVESKAIRTFLKTLKYPLYFLDFETFMTAVPPYDEMSPYDQTPFQYSLHVINAPGSKAEHYSYLSNDAADPRPEILSKLKSLLGQIGSIVAYNASFEIRVLQSCANYFPEYRMWFETIQPRFVDLLVPFREFHYYHSDQKGSASLKAVLPALTARSYAGLEIADGLAASLRFRDMAFGNLPEDEKKEIREALEIYCHQDTEAMIEILKALEKAAKS